MFNFIKQAFISLLSFSGSLDRVVKVCDHTQISKKISYLARLSLINLNSNEFHSNPFVGRINRYDEIFQYSWWFFK